MKFIRYSDDGRAALYEHSDGSRFYWHLQKPRAIDIYPTDKLQEMIKKYSIPKVEKPCNDYIHW